MTYGMCNGHQTMGIFSGDVILQRVAFFSISSVPHLSVTGSCISGQQGDNGDFWLGPK